MYYAAFGKENGDFEGFELNYLVAILLTIMLSFLFIIREVAARMTSASNYWETEYPARRQPFESPPFSFWQSVPVRLLCVAHFPVYPAVHHAAVYVGRLFGQLIYFTEAQGWSS